MHDDIPDRIFELSSFVSAQFTSLGFGEGQYLMAAIDPVFYPMSSYDPKDLLKTTFAEDKVTIGKIDASERTLFLINVWLKLKEVGDRYDAVPNNEGNIVNPITKQIIDDILINKKVMNINAVVARKYGW